MFSVGSAGALPALGSVRVAACARRSRRGDRCRLDMLAKGPWSARACLARARAALGVSRVSMLRCFVFATAIDRAARRLARGAHTAPSLGWRPPGGHGLDPP